MNTSSSDPNMLQLHDKINTEQALLSELQHRQDNGQTSVHSLEQNVDGHSPATAKLLSDITILRNILQQMETINVHIDQTLINSVPVMKNIGSVGHILGSELLVFISAVLTSSRIPSLDLISRNLFSTFVSTIFWSRERIRILDVNVRISQNSAVPKMPTILIGNKQQNAEVITSLMQNIASRART
jgi:hypothetical protein